MKGHLGINVNANATITMTAREYLETMETYYQNGLKWGSKLEQERIIKLIEDNMDHWDGWLDVKELIKGEQK